ncbi:MAG: DeoR family transcriptional regulator [bacterium]|nr:DeoR family transcriptional regulator [bacterium]
MNSEERVLEITLALYRVTDPFPKDEVLKQTLRKQGLKILELVVRQDDNEEIINNIKIIRYHLRLAKILRVTNPANLEVLQREYRRLAEQFLKEAEPTVRVTQHKPATVSDEINDRQKTILEYLKHKKQAQVGDLQNIFKNISSKTIQRDLHDLVARNILTRDGDKRWTTYCLMDKVQ